MMSLEPTQDILIPIVMLALFCGSMEKNLSLVDKMKKVQKKFMRNLWNDVRNNKEDAQNYE